MKMCHSNWVAHSAISFADVERLCLNAIMQAGFTLTKFGIKMWGKFFH
jgi:hypothetical protein